MASRSHLRSALVIALVLHGAAFFFAGRARRDDAIAPATRASTPETEVDVEQAQVDPTPTTPPTPTPTSTPSTAASDAVAARAQPPSDAREGSSARTEVARGTNGGPATSASAEKTDGTGWAFSPIMPGSGDAGAAPTDRLAEVTRAGVRAMLDEQEKQKPAERPPIFPRFTRRDIELGLAPGGHLVTLAREEVRRSLVPDVSNALLEITTDSAGVVASIRVLEASSGRQEWSEVATDMLASARRKPLSVPIGTKGLTIRLELSSSLKTVSGATPSTDPLSKVTRALNNPIDTLVDSRTRPQRVVAGRVVAVDTL